MENNMKNTVKGVVLILATTSLFALYGCDSSEEPLEEAGETIEESMEETGEAIEEAAEKTKESLEESTDNTN